MLWVGDLTAESEFFVNGKNANSLPDRVAIGCGIRIFKVTSQAHENQALKQKRDKAIRLRSDKEILR